MFLICETRTYFRILFQIYDLIDGVINSRNSRLAGAGLSFELNILKKTKCDKNRCS